MQFDFTVKEKELGNLIGTKAAEMGCTAYFVGGFVRDRLIGRDSPDVDIVCVGDGVKLARNIAADLGVDNVVVYKRYGTAMFQYGDLELEFVGARKESYRDHSRNPEVVEGSLEDDQNRRDFTINALAVSLNEPDFGDILDPFNGLSDLDKGIIRTPGDPARTFSDDPLRMMRAVRFATQLGFQIDARTFKGIKNNAQRLEIISAERINTELNKIILSNTPSIGFNMLSQAGLLGQFLPEFENLRGVEHVDGIGHKDNFYHTLKVLDNVSRMSDDLWLRWAAVLHDIAKPPTKKFIPGTGWTFHGHEVVGVHMAKKIFKRLRLPLDDKLKYVQKMIRLHLRPISLTKEDITDSAIRRLLFDAGDDIDDLMILCKADITSKNEHKVRRIKENYEKIKVKLKEVEEKDRIRNWQPPISGDIIMETFNIKPSRIVGDIKDTIREAILDGVIPNDYQAAFDFMIEEGRKLGLKPG